MIEFRAFAFTIATILVIGAQSASVDAQAAPQTSQSQSIIASVAMEKTSVPAGEKPLAEVTINNVGDLMVCMFNGSNTYRVHVEGKDGEPPKTEFHRHLLGDFRPGDGPGLSSGPVVCTEIAPPMAGFPGMSKTFEFDLAAFYDLNLPGRYSVYIEFYDPSGPRDGSGIWVRTNTAQFEVEAKAQ